MSEFDEKAATWDEDTSRVERASFLAKLMRENISFRDVHSALEYGSGTGLLGFNFVDEVASLTLMDVSENMINVAQKKALQNGHSNVKAIRYDLLSMPLPDDRYDLIFILLTLHHIDDTEAILEKFATLLNKNGVLVIYDLEKEDGSFHDGEFHGHLGYDKAELTAKIIRAGFKIKKFETAMNIPKEMPDGKLKQFPLFVLIAEKE